ncbi:bacitracin ABC transporter ATP-binding protein BcrA family protein [Mycoplasma sp. CAG:611]|jgi:bacitracin transport ATP-binding protein bcrA family protein|nr:bacitracin ABC transporter ATP-binding protein BcrA family protein [Mycoplasma sp. CAG:611]
MKLEIKNLSKKFKDVYVLKDINLTFESGKIYGFTGRNGSGKSVLLKIICGFYTPTSGEVLLDNYNYILNNDFPKSTRCLIEKPNFLPDLTGYENLKLLASIENKIGDKEIMDTIEKLNLKEEINKKYSKYSLGTKQKLGIAQVLMEDPKLIVLDEPLNGIENETAKEVRKILNEEKKKDKIIIVASHIKEDIDTLADVVYNIDNGIVEKIKG